MNNSNLLQHRHGGTLKWRPHSSKVWLRMKKISNSWEFNSISQNLVFRFALNPFMYFYYLTIVSPCQFTTLKELLPTFFTCWAAERGILDPLYFSAICRLHIYLLYVAQVLKNCSENAENFKMLKIIIDDQWWYEEVNPSLLFSAICRLYVLVRRQNCLEHSIVRRFHADTDFQWYRAHPKNQNF